MENSVPIVLVIIFIIIVLGIIIFVFTKFLNLRHTFSNLKQICKGELDINKVLTDLKLPNPLQICDDTFEKIGNSNLLGNAQQSCLHLFESDNSQHIGKSICKIVGGSEEACDKLIADKTFATKICSTLSTHTNSLNTKLQQGLSKLQTNVCHSSNQKLLNTICKFI